MIQFGIEMRENAGKAVQVETYFLVGTSAGTIGLSKVEMCKPKPQQAKLGRSGRSRN